MTLFSCATKFQSTYISEHVYLSFDAKMLSYFILLAKLEDIEMSKFFQSGTTKVDCEKYKIEFDFISSLRMDISEDVERSRGFSEY